MIAPRCLSIALGLLSGACGVSADDESLDAGIGGASESCHRCGEPSPLGTIANADVREASGIAASAIHEGVYYVHNDASDVARFFALSEHGDDLGQWLVSGASAVDWEDVARGPCGDGEGSCLYFADTGDNNAARTDFAIYRVREPTIVSPGEHGIEAESFPFVYPEGGHDAETLLVHPVTGVITIVTKVEAGASRVYEMPMPLTPGRSTELVARTSLTPPTGSQGFTGGAVSPTGTRVLLRTYSTLFAFDVAAEQDVAEALATDACEVPHAVEQQGEAVTWNQAGTGYMTVGEGVSSRLSYVECSY